MKKINSNEIISFSEIINICGGKENYRKFDCLQIKEIMSGITSGLRPDEVQGLYVNSKIPYEEMRIIKNRALFERQPREELIKLREYLLLVWQYYDLLEKDYLNVDEIYDCLKSELLVKGKKILFGCEINVRTEEEINECVYALAHAAYLRNQESALQNPKINKHVLEMKNK